MTGHLSSNLPHHTNMTPCDLYPILSDADLANALPHLSSFAAYETVTALRLCLSQKLDPALLRSLTECLYPHNVALIIAPLDSRLLESLPLDHIDGVHMPSLRELKAVPTSFNKKKLSLQTGCTCQTLDDAMRAGEQGADYVAFPATEKTAITQWSLMTELPTVAENVTSLESAQEARLAGADFLSVSLRGDENDHTLLAAVDKFLS
ncbi:thiamine phosphate synthase [Saccharibacter floricola]|uniref:thiamine phosphate synthase n=1 Tax=Saccharibacter floricola TaxID=231053 RepID=UPI00037E3146|nr:thiamine phosphate synthase [Saccharibacter floricola]